MKQNINNPLLLFLRAILKLIIKSILIFFIKFKIEAKENLPKTKNSLIIISNHAAYIDSVYFICSIKPCFVICGAKQEYFRTALKRFLLGMANIIKVESKEQFLRDCGELLNEGEIILIYPEMGRNKYNMGEFKTWAAEAALMYNTPVLPCYIQGTTKDSALPKKLIVGSSFLPEEKTAQVLTSEFRKKILNLKNKNNKE